MSSIEDIQKLRNSTGAGMMAAKTALEQAGGDFDKAVMVLRQQGQAIAAKKSDREAKAGLIDSYIHQGRVGALVEVNCETDFVARTDDFKNFVHEVAMQVAAANPLYVNQADVPAAVIAAETKLYKSQLKPDIKPEIKEQALQGKLKAYYGQTCLLDQPYLREPEKTINDLLTELIAKLGENIVISRIQRMELGG